MKAITALLCPILAAGLYAAPQADSGARVEEWTAFLEGVRQRALNHLQSLPDFICVREMNESATMGAITNPISVTESKVEVSYLRGTENYKGIKQGPVAPDIGLVSSGEFGGSLHSIFDPASKGSFRLKGFENVRGRKTARIQFQVPEESSQLTIQFGQRKLSPAYEGECWADRESKQIVRFKLSVPQLPRDFHIQRAEQSVEYDQVRIGERSYWLPVSAVSNGWLVAKAGGNAIDLYQTIFGQPCTMSYDKAAVKILIKFKNYRKFETESKLVAE
jgi:hypothetical protein